MSSKEPKQTQTIRELLEDPDIQRRAHTWAERLVRRYKLAPMTGEDLYQQAITKLIRYANSEEPREIERPLGFLFTVLSNEARRNFSIIHAETVGLEDVPSGKFSDNFETAQRMESGILLIQAYDGLDSDEERELFKDILQGYTTRELAVKLKISHVTASHRRNQLIKKILKFLF